MRKANNEKHYIEATYSQPRNLKPEIKINIVEAKKLYSLIIDKFAIIHKKEEILP